MGDGLSAVADRGTDRLMLQVNCDAMPLPSSTTEVRTEVTA